SFSNIERFQITGTLANDTITTGDGNDTISAGAGNDIINTGNGNDRLIGVAQNSVNPGLGEIDVLQGGTGGDIYVIGNAATTFYDDGNSTTAGITDYARIVSFNVSEDIIQLTGPKSNYILGSSPINNITGTAIYIKKPIGEPDELIAIVEGVTGLNLNSNVFIEAQNESGLLSFSQATFSTPESNNATITITREQGTVGAVSVTLALTNGTAIAPSDYDNTSITVNFADGENSKTITIPIVNDNIYESNETVNLTLINPTNGASLGTQKTANLTIVDNDALPGTIAFSETNYSVSEDGTPINQVTLTRTGGSDGVVSITVVPTNGTATAPSDFISNPITVSFANGETSKTVTIPVINDTVYESNESVNLALSNPIGGATIGAQNTAILSIVDNDAFPGILAFSSANYSINEDGTPIAAVTINRTGGTNGDVSVILTLSNGSAIAPDDYFNTPTNVTFASGETSKTINIPIVNDTVYEPTETINLTLSNPTNSAILGTQVNAVISIIDNDAVPGTIAFSQATYSVNENGTPISQVTLTRTGGSDGEVSVLLTPSGGSATAPDDYNNTPITVIFTNAETSKTVSIPIVNDSKFEANETINLILSNATGGATIGIQNNATLTIVNDDPFLPGAIAFSAANYSVNEDGTPINQVTLTRTGGSDGEISVLLTPSNGSATAPNDYNNTPITVIFADGEISKTVTVPIVDDTKFEANETVTLSLSNPTGGATLATQQTATLTIINNDAPQQGILAFSNPTYIINEDGTTANQITVIRTGGSDGEVSVTVNLSDVTATALSDYANTPIIVIFADGDTTPKTVAIPINNDTLVENTETLNLTLTNPTGGATIGEQQTAVVAIADDDVQLNFSASNYTVREDGTAVTNIIVTRTGRATGAVSATVTFTDGTAIGCGCAANSVNNDFYNGSFVVSLADGETSKVIPVELASLGGTNAIRIRNDAKVETNETFTINLTNPTSEATIGNRSSAVITILDDDVELAFSAANFSVRENGQAIAAVTVTRNGRLTGDVGASITLSGGTASYPDDYSQTVINFTLEDGVTSKVIEIPIQNDILVEPDETVTLTLTSPTGGATLGNQNTATLTIVDNGTTPSLSVSINKDTVAESAGINAAIGTVTRNIVTNEDLVITLNSSDTTEATVPLQVTILANQASANFAINTIDDGVADGAQTVNITASANGFNSGSRNITVTDINVPDLVVSSLYTTTPLLTGKQASFRYRVENKGLSSVITSEDNPLVDRIYLSKDTQLDNGDTLLGEFKINANIPVGQFYERNLPFFTPKNAGTFYLIGVTDATNILGEGGNIGDNNNTTITQINVLPAYRAVVSTDVEVGIAGQSVNLRGQALSNADNSPIAFEFVTIKVENNGILRELNAFTDANGNFVRAFNPLPTEGGQYKINAYFPGNPTEDNVPEDTFKLLGMRFNTNQASHKVIADSPFTASVNLQNLTDIGLTGITATVDSVVNGWDVQVNAPINLAASGQNTLTYTITAPNDSVITQDTFNIKLTSAEGVTTTLPIAVNLERIVPRLVASSNLLSSGMLKGNQTVVEFDVTNEGGAIAEDIQVLLPDAPWLKLASPVTIDKLGVGESTKVTLLLTPDTNLEIGEYKGNVVLDAAGNDGDLSLGFNFRAISDAVGSLRINVENELTYFAEGSPKLANATVILRDYFTGNEVRRVVTDNTGIVSWDGIAEGYYKLDITADKHTSYSQTLKIDAGEIENVNSFLSRQTVKYIWTVTPTEIQDEYKINVESVFETNVLVPTVVIDPPQIDLAELTEVGQVMQINLTATNYGLIAAKDINLGIQSHPFYKFEPLINGIDTLAAKSSLTIPVRITKIGDFDSINNSLNGFKTLSSSENSFIEDPSIPCVITAGISFSYECSGETIKRAIPVPFLNAEGNCHPVIYSILGQIGRGIDELLKLFDRGGTGSSGRFGNSGIIIDTGEIQQAADCDPCKEKIKQAIIDCVVKKVGLNILISKQVKPKTIANCIINIIKACPDFFNPLGNTLSSSTITTSFLQSTLDELEQELANLKPLIDTHIFLFGNEVWMQSGEEDPSVFANWVETFEGFINLSNYNKENLVDWLDTYDNLIRSLLRETSRISDVERNELLQTTLPSGISASDVNRLIDRWNRTFDYYEANIFNLGDVPDGQSSDFIALDVWKELLAAARKTIEISEASGFTDPIEQALESIDNLQEVLNSDSNGVCAKVSIKIDQDAVMTRSAFLGELEIDNGNTTNLENLTVTLQVKDAQGNIVNNLFGITNPILKNITAIDGTGILTGDDPNTPQDEGIGSAQWTFIPTNLAAPEVPTQYSIGGTLSYTENGQRITVPLLSTPITVYPQAELYLDYFQQRNVYGDDPFTDQTETSVPFSLGVLVKNQGKGDAKNLKITSAQPKIVDNEKGLLIDFQIIGSQVNNETVNPSLTVNFGNIAAGQTAVADWLLKSSLQGKFIEYKATFEHVNGLNNPELSLIKEVKIHELIRKVRANDDNLTDFLVNDVFDANFDPDTLYFSSGTTAPVKVVTNATTDGAATFEDLTVQLSATVESGWTYLRLNDPGNGQFQIKKVLRSDGTEVILDNVWTTDRTFPATGRPIYENILHLLDNNTTAGTQTYTITYTTGDQTPPKVREIVDVDPNPRNTPVNTLDVVFTEPIKTATFDTSDITLTLDGVAVNTNNLSITPVNANTYRIGNLQGITGNVGQYQLSVNAAGVQDFEGISGTGVVTENWIFTGERPTVASISGFTSNRLKTPVNTATVSFTEAINPSSFDFSDLFLNRNGGGDLIKSTVTITPINATTYQINNLGDLTNVDGEYSFLINARGVTDTDGNTGVGAKGFTWTLDTNAPSLLSITDVTSPRNTKVSTLDIAFSKLIDSTTFDLSDVILTRDGTTNLITNGVSFTQLNNTTYRFSGLNGLQTTDGTYSFTVVGSGIKDTAGNIVTNSLSENWTLDTIAPNAATNIQVTANLNPSGIANGTQDGEIASLSLAMTNTSLGILNEFGQVRVNSTSINISGSLDETGLKVYIRDKNINQSLGQATVNGTNFNSTVQLSGAGARELEIQVVDAAGNTTTTPLSIFADVTAPTLINFLNIPSQPVTTPVGAVDVQFSETINLSTFNYQDITLTRDGGTNLITNAVTISNVSGTTYRINGLETLTQTPGTYNLQINTPGIQDLAGNAGIEPKNTTFTIQGAATPGVTITQSNGSTNVVEGGATDTYTVVLKTQPTADVTITLNTGSQITTNNTTLTFTAANWNTPQTITVTAVNDTTPEGNHTATITHSISSSDNNYNGLTLPNINVAIQDNDAEIRGTVWNDVNGDGIKGNDEPTLLSWTVYLDTNNNSLLDAGETSTLTDSQGNYTFNDLRPGNYTVAQVVQNGWKQTYPIINITTTASTTEIFTPSDPLSVTSNTQTTTATNLINLDDFLADSRFAHIKGQGYTTVIIDTGIDLDHPFFGADNNNDGIGDRIIYQYDFADNDNDASDKNGHGSHIASIAA
ncbi:Calx-beta domain-containing protein, partial [Aulosira sp. FACHB-615]|uniref:Calx-beta domain-containing protein n=1 Tax=Aulosira sp. FACHB-615 TaxID=2692777 RepID=UPI0016888D26